MKARDIFTPDVLARGLQPLYLLFGDAPLLVIEAADAIRGAARADGFDECDVLVAGQGFDWNSLAAAANNMSLFGGRKIIDLRIPSGKPGKDGADALQRYVTQLPVQTLTLVTLPAMDWKARKTVWFETLSAAAQSQCYELNSPPLARLPQWLAGRLAQQKQTATPEALRFLAEHVEGNLLAAHQEVLKLGLLYEQGELTLAQVRSSVLDVARYDIDDLREALLHRDLRRCLHLLEGLRGEGVAPPLILWALATEIRTLAALSEGAQTGQALAALFKQQRIFDNVRKQKLQRLLPHYSVAQLHAALLHAAGIDRLIKGLGNSDIWEEFTRLLRRMCV